MHRSRIIQTLNVPQGVRLSPSLAAALLNGRFEHPAKSSLTVPYVRPIEVLAHHNNFPATC